MPTLALVSFAGVALFSLPVSPPQGPGKAWDTRFFLNGVPDASVLATFDDGSGPALYAGGPIRTADDLPVNRIARWDGQDWSPLGAGLTTTSGNPAEVMAMVVFDDGSGSELYVGGRFMRAGTATANGIAKWNGTRWAPVGSGAASAGIEVHALTVFDDGSGPALYAGGFFSSIGGTAASGIARWNGATWAPLGNGITGFFPGFPGIVEALAAFQGMLYAGGDFETADGLPVNNLARWDGTKWYAIGSGAQRLSGSSASVHTLEVGMDQRGQFLVLGGEFNLLDGRPAESVGRWNGESFEPIGPGLRFGSVESVAQFDDGSGMALYAGGVFFLPLGGPRVSIARWDGRSWALVGEDLTVENGTAPVSDLEVFDAGPQKTLFAAGGFEFSGDRVVNGVAELRGGEWFALSEIGQGVDVGINAGDTTPISAFEVWDDGSGEALYAAGNLLVAGTTAVSRVAKWNGDRWSPVGEGVHGFFSDQVLDLAVFDDGNGAGLYAGGTFSGAGSVLASAIARWDGVAWWPLGSGLAAPGLGFQPGAYVLHVFDDGSGPALFVGGAFSEAGGVPVHSIARWNGTSWSDVGGGVTESQIGVVHSLAVFDDGTGPALFVGGRFDQAGGVTAHSLAKWNGTSWTGVGGGFDPSVSTVYALAVFEDGGSETLYAGGQFFTAGGMSADNLARWDGTSWTAVGLQGEVFDLTVHDDGAGPALYAGGEFTRTAGGQTLNRIGRWNGSAWASLGTGINGSRLPRVEALQSFSHDGVPALYAGGNFDTASGSRSSNIARWSDRNKRRAR